MIEFSLCLVFSLPMNCFPFDIKVQPKAFVRFSARFCSACFCLYILDSPLFFSLFFSVFGFFILRWNFAWIFYALHF